METTSAELLNLQGMSLAEEAWLGVREGDGPIIDLNFPPVVEKASKLISDLWSRRDRLFVEGVTATVVAGTVLAAGAVGKVLAANEIEPPAGVDPVHLVILGYALAREPMSTGLGGALRIRDRRRDDYKQFKAQIELLTQQLQAKGFDHPDAPAYSSQIKYFQQQRAMYDVQRLTSIFSGEALREFGEGVLVSLIRMGSPFVAVGLYELYKYMDQVGKNTEFNITGNPQIDALAKLGIPALATVVGLGYGALWVFAEREFWAINAPGGKTGREEEARNRRDEVAAKEVKKRSETAALPAPVQKKEDKVQKKGVRSVTLAGISRRQPGTSRRVGQ